MSSAALGASSILVARHIFRSGGFQHPPQKSKPGNASSFEIDCRIDGNQVLECL